MPNIGYVDLLLDNIFNKRDFLTCSSFTAAPKKGSEIVVIVGAVVGVAVLGLVFAGLYVWRHKRRKVSSEQQGR